MGKEVNELATISGLENDDLLVVYDTSATADEKLKNITFSDFSSTVNVATDHKDLSGLQGGTTDEYYHITAAQEGDFITGTEVAALIATISGELDDHSELNGLDYASAGHTGFQPAGDYATSTEVTDDIATFSGTIDHDTIVNNHNLTTDIDHDALTNFAVGEHRIINDSGDSATELWSAEQIESRVVTATGTLTSDHGDLTGLDDNDHTQYLPRTDFTTYSGSMVVDWTAADGVVTAAYIAADVVLDTKIDTTSGTLQGDIDDHLHVDYVPWDYGANTISGTGDIYCNDIYTSSGTVYIGDVQLSSSSGTLQVAGDPVATESIVPYIKSGRYGPVTSGINDYRFVEFDSNEVDADYRISLALVVTNVTVIDGDPDILPFEDFTHVFNPTISGFYLLMPREYNPGTYIVKHYYDWMITR